MGDTTICGISKSTMDKLVDSLPAKPLKYDHVKSRFCTTTGYIGVRTISTSFSGFVKAMEDTLTGSESRKILSLTTNEYIQIFDIYGAECLKNKEAQLKEEIISALKESNIPLDLVAYVDVNKVVKNNPIFSVVLTDSKGKLVKTDSIKWVKCTGTDPDTLPLAKTVYSPHAPYTIPAADVEDNITHINTWVPPKWMKGLNLKEVANLPPTKPPVLFERLLNHLIPDEAERDFFIHWTYKSLVSRASTFLVLVGKPGIGKNVTVKVLEALHGHSDNVQLGKNNTFTSSFNSVFTGCTLLFCDEAVIGRNAESTLKQLANGEISVERKGVNASKSERVYASVILSSNHEQDIYVPYDGRKFACLDLTRDRLETSFTSKEIGEIATKTQSDTVDWDFVEDIGMYVLTYGSKLQDKYNYINDEFRGKGFLRMAYANTNFNILKLATHIEENWDDISIACVTDENGFTGVNLKEIADSFRKKRENRDMTKNHGVLCHTLGIILNSSMTNRFELSVTEKIEDTLIRPVNKTKNTEDLSSLL